MFHDDPAPFFPCSFPPPADRFRPVGLRHQQRAHCRRGGEGQMGRCAGAISAPLQPDRQSGRHGEGGWQAGTGHAGPRDGSPRQGDLGPGECRRPLRPRQGPAVPAGPGATEPRPWATARIGRGLS